MVSSSNDHRNDSNDSVCSKVSNKQLMRTAYTDSLEKGVTALLILEVQTLMMRKVR